MRHITIFEVSLYNIQNEGVDGTDKKSFGKRLKYARKLSGLSADAVANAIHLGSGNYYYRYERGERMPPPETIVELCTLLKTSPNYLFASDLVEVDDLDMKISMLPPDERTIALVVVNALLKKSEVGIDIFTEDNESGTQGSSEDEE